MDDERGIMRQAYFTALIQVTIVLPLVMLLGIGSLHGHLVWFVPAAVVLFLASLWWSYARVVRRPTTAAVDRA